MGRENEKPYWALLSSEALIRAGSGETGLSSAEAHRRIRRDGPNQLTAAKKKPDWRRFLGQFASPFSATLLVAAILAAIFGDTVDAAAIAAILLLNAIMSFVQENRAERALEALKKMAAPKARVLRDGRVQSVATEDICMGDVLIVEAGDYVGADARLLSAHQLTANEAALTGESVPVEKIIDPGAAAAPLAERMNSLFAGTLVEAGSGQAVVMAIGMQTEIGRIAAMLEAGQDETTPLQHRLRAVGNRLILFSGAVTLIVAGLGFYNGETWLNVMLAAISLAVAAIPEGLPTVVTLALALAVRRMAKRNAIIRFLPAVETLGMAEVICTDKTGTLTTGAMRVREGWINGRLFDLTQPETSHDAGIRALLEAVVLCNNASLDGSGAATGDSTEVAFLRAAAGFGMDTDAFKCSRPRAAEWAFDSIRKRMSVAVRNPESMAYYVKGAPESILPYCTLPEFEREAARQAAESLSSQGRRLLAVAWLPPGTPDRGATPTAAEVERDLIFLGLLTLADPPRPEAIQAIAECQKAGIRVVMITGDHPATGRAIAQEMGILSDPNFTHVATGFEIQAMDNKTLCEHVRNTAVYARVAPEDKLRIVRAWKQNGKIVAMTGDGVNDAPALKEASIGIAMGKGGTEVARQAADMVLADDNFATIVAAVEEGRAVYGNISRTIQYLLAGNVAEIFVMLGAGIAGWPLPLLPLHLLWINLVTDGLPTLALAAEPVPTDTLARNQNRPMDSRFYIRILLTGLFAGTLTLGVFAWFLTYRSTTEARTLAFTFLVFEELFRSFSARHATKTALRIGIGLNRFHLAAVAIPFAFQLAVLQIMPLQQLFKTAPVSWSEVGAIFLLAAVPGLFLEMEKVWRAR